MASMFTQSLYGGLVALVNEQYYIINLVLREEAVPRVQSLLL